jgi:predicted ATPase
MIRKLSISNFRSLADGVEIRLGPLTALVGQNGSGKSNIVDALRFLGDCVRLGLEGAITKRSGIGAVRRWSSGHPYDLSIDLELGNARYGFTLAGARSEEYRVKREEAEVIVDGEAYRYKLEENRWVEGPGDLRPQVDPLNLALPLVGGDERFRPLAEYLRGIAIYSIFPDILREPQKYDPWKPMKEHGSNWVSILKDHGKNSWKDDLLAALGQLTGDIEDLEIRPTGGYLVIRFKHSSTEKRAKWFDAVQESDGTLRFAGILTALLQRTSLSVIGLEEPELTIHPGALPLLCDFIRERARKQQVILTTHSPDLLDQLQAEEVRIVERHEGKTGVAPLDEHQREAIRDHLLTLGEMFRTEGLKPRQLALD